MGHLYHGYVSHNQRLHLQFANYHPLGLTWLVWTYSPGVIRSGFLCL